MKIYLCLVVAVWLILPHCNGFLFAGKKGSVLSEGPIKGSYPTRNNDQVKWFVDGQSYFSTVADALEAAQEHIMITGWWLHPTLYLKRDPYDSRWLLNNTLYRKANQNVKIHVLIWQEVKVPNMVPEHASAYTMKTLSNMHENIKVLRHGDGFNVDVRDGLKGIHLRPFWTHHEKVIVIDRKVAFVGGQDLAFGRWDNESHRLSDPKKELWPGKDYINDHEKEIIKIDQPFEDHINRANTSRLPWHDIHAMVIGEAAIDFASHFEQRWQVAWSECCKYWSRFANVFLSDNFMTDTSCGDKQKMQCGGFWCKSGIKTCTYDGLKPTKSVSNNDLNNFIQNIKATPAQVQALRSVSKWSAGQETERSIQDAYIHLIKNAEHYVYIENQFFISTIMPKDGSGKYVKNGIAEAIVERIGRAYKEKKNFRVYIVVPLMPGFDTKSEYMPIVLQWIYRSISHGERSIWNNLMAKVGGAENIPNFITFCSLSTWDVHEGADADGKPRQQLSLEPIYIHSKILIVDDKYTVIASANLNDRSMQGDRDSDVGVLVTDTKFYDSKMDGKPYKAGEFAGKLRQHLFNESLGQLPSVNNDPHVQQRKLNSSLYVPGIIDVQDPVSDAFFKLWNGIAENNTKAYEQVFGIRAPSDKIGTLEQWEESRKPLESTTQKPSKQRGLPLPFGFVDESFFQWLVKEMSAIAELSKKEDLQKQVRGYLVTFPKWFLIGSKLEENKYKEWFYFNMDKDMYT